jgi:hypothetical protein
MKRLWLPLAALLAAVPAAAQTLREFDYTRPSKGERRLRAVVAFAAGRMTVRPAAAGTLYGLALHYDADRFRPIGSYDAAAGTVRLGVEGTGGGGIRVDRREALPQTAVVELPGSADLSLDVTVGAAEADLELGGLSLSDLTVAAGASRTSVRFDRPNGARCGRAAFGTGAGELTVSGAGNGGCAAWRFDGGVGAMTIDLGGAWPADARMTISTALGGIRLVAPKDLGLRVTMGGLLAGFDGRGFDRAGGVYTSANYAKAARHVDVEVSSALGGVTVEWR